jgi:signal peptidase II
MVMRERATLRWDSLVAVGLYVVVLDQLAKAAVRSFVGSGEYFHVVGTLWIGRFHNPGIAGGSLPGHAVPMSFLATLAVAALLVLLARVGAAGRPVLVGFGLVIGGGLGNLIDRLRLGYVTDFIVDGNSAFNLADIAILAGTTLILGGVLISLVRPRLQSATPQPIADSADD